MNRSKMLKIYEEKYKNIPDNIRDRLCYLFESLNIKDKDIVEIKEDIDRILNIKENTIRITLYEIPLPSSRPRYSSVLGGFYVKNAKSNNNHMVKYMKDKGINNKIITEMKLDISFYLPTPNAMKKKDKILSELKMVRPLAKPDNDNIAKTYQDMMNMNLFIDDSNIVDLHIKKFYSAKPRVDIEIIYKEEFSSEYNKRKIFKSKVYDKFIGKV